MPKLLNSPSPKSGRAEVILVGKPVDQVRYVVTGGLCSRRCHSSGLETGTGDGDGPRRRLVAGEEEAMRKREVACNDAAKGTRYEARGKAAE